MFPRGVAVATGGGGLVGVERVIGALGIWLMDSFKSGSLRAFNSARLNLCADRSAFKAAAVVTAT